MYPIVAVPRRRAVGGTTSKRQWLVRIDTTGNGRHIQPAMVDAEDGAMALAIQSDAPSGPDRISLRAVLKGATWTAYQQENGKVPDDNIGHARGFTGHRLDRTVDSCYVSRPPVHVAAYKSNNRTSLRQLTAGDGFLGNIWLGTYDAALPNSTDQFHGFTRENSQLPQI